MLRIVNHQVSNQSPRLDSPRAEFSAEALEHHLALLESYFQSHRIRNHSEKTIQKQRSLLMGWFSEHGPMNRPLYTWEAMLPRLGRDRVVEYGRGLQHSELSSDTIRAYLGILRNYFAYVLEHPFVKTPSGFVRLQELYGKMDQPISEYDMPVHTYDGERSGVPFDLRNFTSFTRS